MENLNIQMYSFFEGSGADYDTRACLRKAAGIGFTGVEFFGPNFEIPAPEMKELLDELGLTPVSLHMPSTDAIRDMIDYAKTLGMKFVGIGREVMMNEDEVHAFARKLNELGKLCRENGLTLTYHNHTEEFYIYSGKTITDILMEETDPDYVSFELDAGWCAAAGTDPIEIVTKYSGRVKLIHIKESDKVIGASKPFDESTLEKDEHGAPIFTEEFMSMFREKQQLNCRAGQGLVDWKKLREIADAHGCCAYIVEREQGLHDTREETLREDFNYYTANC